MTPSTTSLRRSFSRAGGNRDILVIASDLSKIRAQISIDYTDILPVQDQISNLSGESIDIILETPGGVGEFVEDIVVEEEKEKSVLIDAEIDFSIFEDTDDDLFDDSDLEEEDIPEEL